MIQNSEITRNNLVFKNSSGRYVYPVTMIGNDYHCSSQTH